MKIALKLVNKDRIEHRIDQWYRSLEMRFLKTGRRFKPYENEFRRLRGLTEDRNTIRQPWRPSRRMALPPDWHTT